MNRVTKPIEQGLAPGATPRSSLIGPKSVPAVLLAVLFAAVLVSACGGSSDADDGIAVVDGGNASNASTTTDADAGGGDGSDADGDNDGSGDGSDGSGDGGDGDDGTTSSLPAAGPGEDDDDLPGEAFDIVPIAGTALDVIGVRYDDSLNFRTLPSASAPIVDMVEPQATTPAIVSTGEGRLLTNSIWWKVTVGGEEAWANQRFLGMLGVTIDVLPDITDGLDSTTGPTIEGMLDDIAATYETEGDRGYEMVTEIDAIDATAAQVVIDVLGFGDDAVQGERVLLTFDFVFEDDEVVAYELTGAAGTALCSRGVTEDDLCV